MRPLNEKRGSNIIFRYLSLFTLNIRLPCRSTKGRRLSDSCLPKMIYNTKIQFYHFYSWKFCGCTKAQSPHQQKFWRARKFKSNTTHNVIAVDWRLGIKLFWKKREFMKVYYWYEAVKVFCIILLHAVSVGHRKFSRRHNIFDCCINHKFRIRSAIRSLTPLLLLVCCKFVWYWRIILSIVPCNVRLDLSLIL